MVKIKFSSLVHKLRMIGSLGRVYLGGRVPLYCEWEITDRCNMRCDFCSTRNRNTAGTEEVGTAQALYLIDQLSELGSGMLHFSGGEPTLRPDIAQLVRRAKEKNILVSLTTNGSASCETMAELLDVDLIRVSIDGPQHFHDSLRSSPGAFKKAIETLRFLISHGKKPLITSVYVEGTSSQILEELVDIARSLRVRVSLNMLDKYLNREDSQVIRDSSAGYIDSDLFRGYAAAMRLLRKKYGNTVASPQPYLSVLQKGGLEKYGCRAMDIAICLKSDGSVSLPCTGLTLQRLKGCLKDIYYGPQAAPMKLLQGKHPLCKACAIRCMISASALLKLTGMFSVVDSYGRSFIR